jgi:hypothetical protein
MTNATKATETRAWAAARMMDAANLLKEAAVALEAVADLDKALALRAGVRDAQALAREVQREVREAGGRTTQLPRKIRPPQSPR